MQVCRAFSPPLTSRALLASILSQRSTCILKGYCISCGCLFFCVWFTCPPHTNQETSTDFLWGKSQQMLLISASLAKFANISQMDPSDRSEKDQLVHGPGALLQFIDETLVGRWVKVVLLVLHVPGTAGTVVISITTLLNHFLVHVRFLKLHTTSQWRSSAGTDW